ncbi:MAG TPA: glycosyltransferase [Flavisolibacter sp.]|jgi:rhamnosyltransferase|nr:glycosyltransferase [Flavisolibacter sp.]
MDISGVVILYHPDAEEVILNIRSYIDYVSNLIVFDNSSCSNDIIEAVKAISSKIVVIQNQQNDGIAKPLNKAVQICGDKTEWLLTMDQDSYFEQWQASTFFDAFRRILYQTENIAIVCPAHSSETSSTTINDEYKEVHRAITSGSLINVRICKQLHGFDEKLFIDDVDFEYCYKCVLEGFKIVQFKNIYLNHFIGTQKEAGYFSVLKKSNRSVHSPIRIYYMVRNFLYVSSKYKKQLPKEIEQRRSELFVILKNNLFFSGYFFKVLTAIIKGYLHFKLNKFSS